MSMRTPCHCRRAERIGIDWVIRFGQEYMGSDLFVLRGARSENKGHRNSVTNSQASALLALRTPLCTGFLSRPRPKPRPILLHLLEREGGRPEPHHSACPNRRWIFVDWLGTG